MATEFTIFPKLITELRLEIWRMAMPAPLTRALYPYKKGCWVVEDLGLEPDFNGEDLHMIFDTTRLDPLRIDIPLYAVNREARGVALEYIRKHNLVAHSLPTQFLRRFTPSTDTMFLPTSEIETFIVEQIDRASDPSLEDHHYSISRPVLSRLAVTIPGLEILKYDLGDFYDTAAPIDSLYVVDVAHNSTYSPEELENAVKSTSVDLAATQDARLTWRSETREWETEGDDTTPTAMARRRLVMGLDDPASSTSDFDLEVCFVRVN